MGHAALLIYSVLMVLCVHTTESSECGAVPFTRNAANWTESCANTQANSECTNLSCVSGYVFPFNSPLVCNDDAEWDVPTPQCLTPSEIICATQQTCESCTRKTACTWCDSRGACVPGTQFGPQQEDLCPVGPHYYSRCAGTHTHPNPGLISYNIGAITNHSALHPGYLDCFNICNSVTGVCSFNDVDCYGFVLYYDDTPCENGYLEVDVINDDARCVCVNGFDGVNCTVPVCPGTSCDTSDTLPQSYVSQSLECVSESRDLLPFLPAPYQGGTVQVAECVTISE